VGIVIVGFNNVFEECHC